MTYPLPASPANRKHNYSLPVVLLQADKPIDIFNSLTFSLQTNVPTDPGTTDSGQMKSRIRLIDFTFPHISEHYVSETKRQEKC